MHEITEPAGERVYVLVQGSAGYEYYIMRYRLRPLLVNDAPRCLPADGTADRFSAICPPDEWWNVLMQENYGYVFVVSADEAFCRDCGKLFDRPNRIGTAQLYRADREKQKPVLLD